MLLLAFFPRFELFWQSSLAGVSLVLIGLCVGSFLNVVIHRVPRGLSVNEPKRSFCPHCKKAIPAWQNLPVITWLLQRGKCRQCGAPIASRYLLVEVATGVLFYLSWRLFDPFSGLLAIVLCVILVVVCVIDAEHAVIPITWTGVGTGIAIVGAFFEPKLLVLGAGSKGGFDGALLGWAAGFALLWLVIRLGKWAFGKQKVVFEKPVNWHLAEGFEDNPQLHLVIEGAEGAEAHSWDELFNRPTDRLVITGRKFKVNGALKKGAEIVISRNHAEMEGKTYDLEKLKTLEGRAERMTVPREAMGSGDPHLLGMIGAFLGWPAVVFVIFVSSIFGMIVGLAGRIGFGKPIPYGPFLGLAALTWLFFGGWKWWQSYWELIGLS